MTNAFIGDSPHHFDLSTYRCTDCGVPLTTYLKAKDAPGVSTEALECIRRAAPAINSK